MNGRNRSKARPRTVAAASTFGQYSRRTRHDRQRRHRHYACARWSGVR